MSRPGRSRISARATGSAPSSGSLTPSTICSAGIILLDKGAQVFVEARLVAVQRLQHRDGRLIRKYRRRAAGKPYDSHGCPDEIRPGGTQHDGDGKICAHDPRRLRLALRTSLGRAIDRSPMNDCGPEAGTLCSVVVNLLRHLWNKGRSVPRFRIISLPAATLIWIDFSLVAYAQYYPPPSGSGYPPPSYRRLVKP